MIVDGQLHIIDRKSNIVKLGSGDFISIERVEAVYSSCRFVSQLVVFIRAGMLVGVVALNKVECCSNAVS
jgi:long-subunit acyl-CoA synthetase (AMP-forming)